MGSRLLADWTRVRGSATAVTSITQGSEDWISGCDDADATFFVDCRDVNAPAGDTVYLNIESSPSRDDASFQAVTAPIALVAGSSPTVVKTQSLAPNSVPLSRCVRWRLSVSGTASGTWDATFRIGVSGSSFQYFAPTAIADAFLWLRGDVGVVSSGGTVSAWNDQSTAGNNFSPDPTYGYPTTTSLNGQPAVYFDGKIDVPGPSLVCNTTPTYSQPNTYLIVFVATSFGVLSDGVGSNEQIFSIYSNTALELSAGTASFPSVQSVRNPHIYQVDWNGASSALWQDGTLVTTFDAGTNAWQLGYLGGPQSGGGYPRCTIGEVLAYGQVLGASDRTRLTRYLGNKYGIAVP
jgi:hypothetical protein